MEGLDRDYLEDLERRLRDAGRTASVDEANPATLEESDRDAEDADIQEAHDGHRRQQRLAGRQSCPYDHPLGYPLEVGLGPDDLEQKVLEMQHLLSEEATARKEMRRQYEIQLALVRQVEDARVSRAKQTTLAELQETLSLYKCVAEESVQVAKAEREKFRKELEKARFTARKVCEELESELRLEYEARISTLETETKAQADRFAKKEADLHRTVSKLEIQAADGASQFDEQVVKEAENRVNTYKTNVVMLFLCRFDDLVERMQVERQEFDRVFSCMAEKVTSEAEAYEKELLNKLQQVLLKHGVRLSEAQLTAELAECTFTVNTGEAFDDSALQELRKLTNERAYEFDFKT